MRSRLCPFGLAHGIPPTAVGGWLRSSLKRLRPSSIPPTAVGGWLRFSLPDLLSSHTLQQGGWTLTIPQLPRLDFNHPPTAVGGIEERSSKMLSLIKKQTPYIPEVLKLKLNLTITYQNQYG